MTKTGQRKLTLSKILTRVSGLMMCLLLIDQYTKYWARTTIISQPSELIPGFFYLHYSENTGIAWSIPIPELVLMIIIPLLLITGIYISYKYFDYQKNLTIGISAAILAGAIGNYLDRLIFGYVIDFISISTFPIFNFADIYITCAAFIIVVFYGKIERIN